VSTIDNAMRLHLQSIEGGMGRLAMVASAEARSQNASWPFVTIPAFEVLGASVRDQTGFEDIVLLPFVAREDVEEWQRYSLEHAKTWLRESRSISQSEAMKANASGEYTSFVATEYLNIDPTPVLVDVPDAFKKAANGENYTYVDSVTANPQGPYLPFWMKTPPPFNPTIINVNFLSTHNEIPLIVSAVAEARRPLLGESIDMTALAQTSVTLEDHERYHASLVNYRSNGTKSTFQHPHCAYMAPVFENPANSSAKIVAMLVALLPFDRYLINLLPRGVRGIDAVLRNHRSHQSFTYRLVGNSVSGWSRAEEP
jgi:hypothetical protein